MLGVNEKACLGGVFSLLVMGAVIATVSRSRAQLMNQRRYRRGATIW